MTGLLKQLEGWKVLCSNRTYTQDFYYHAPEILTALEQSIALCLEMRYLLKRSRPAYIVKPILTKANTILGE